MITINWTTRVINIPKADLVQIQVTPFEIYEMDLDWFRLQLKDIEDNTDGIVFPTTHNHNTTVTVGGVTLARVIELINDYTVTFEDGQYAVNLVGANSNVADKVNLNQVSVRSANSAGMVQGGAGGGATAAQIWSYSQRKLTADGVTEIQDGLAEQDTSLSIKRTVEDNQALIIAT